MRRRDIVIGGLLAAAAGGGFVAKPRHAISLLGSDQLTDVVPSDIGAWRSRDVSDPVALNNDDDLASRLYNQQLTRLYQNSATGDEVLVLLAYGASQTNELQLHRPEVCFPAFGFDIVRNVPSSVDLGGGVGVPARRLLAKSDEQSQVIVYWSRLGEFFPLDGSEQRMDRIKIALGGIVPDGVLCRFTASVQQDPVAGWKMVSQFARDLVLSVPGSKRQALIGTARARAAAGLRLT